MTDPARIHRLIRDAYAAGARLSVRAGMLICEGPEAACRPLLTVDEPTALAVKCYLDQPTDDERWQALRAAAPGPGLIERAGR